MRIQRLRGHMFPGKGALVLTPHLCHFLSADSKESLRCIMSSFEATNVCQGIRAATLPRFEQSSQVHGAQQLLAPTPRRGAANERRHPAAVTCRGGLHAEERQRCRGTEMGRSTQIPQQLVWYPCTPGARTQICSSLQACASHHNSARDKTASRKPCVREHDS